MASSIVINRWVALCSYLTEDVLDVSHKLSSHWGILESEKGPALLPIAQFQTALSFSPDQIADSIPTALGLALIPFIVTPLDALTEKLLDVVIRPQLKRAFASCEL